MSRGARAPGLTPKEHGMVDSYVIIVNLLASLLTAPTLLWLSFGVKLARAVPEPHSMALT